MDFDSGTNDGEEMARDMVECGLAIARRETHLPSLVNTGGCALVLESVSGCQRHRRGGGSVAIAGPCAACCDGTALDALGFDFRAGIWPNTRPATKNAISHSSRHSPIQIRTCLFFIFFSLDMLIVTFSICKDRRNSVLAYREGRSVRLFISFLYNDSQSNKIHKQ